MKKTLKNTLMMALSIAALSSCTKTGDGCGRVTFSLEELTDIVEVTKSSVSDYTTLPSASDFTVTIKSGTTTVWTGLLSAYDASTSYNAGNYTAEASYGAEGEEGFDKPYFTGSKSFAIEGAGTTSVSIPVKLGNSILKVSCSDAFTTYFPEYSFTVTTGSNNVISFPKGESRAAFIDAYKFTVAGTMTTQTGSSTSFSKEYTSGIEPATCYTLKFDVGNVGNVTITITFNDTVETVDLGSVELNS